jgi:hypothetical protein
MANTSNKHAVRPPQAQSARESRDHHTQSQQATQGTAADPTALAYQRRADAQNRRAKEAARCRDHETTVVWREGDRTGLRPAPLDHRGKGEVV